MKLTAPKQNITQKNVRWKEHFDKGYSIKNLDSQASYEKIIQILQILKWKHSKISTM